jgi:hypothetical protein
VEEKSRGKRNQEKKEAKRERAFQSQDLGVEVWQVGDKITNALDRKIQKYGSLSGCSGQG